MATELPRRTQATQPEPRGAAVAWSESLRRQLARAPVRLAILLLLIIEVVPLVWLLISSFKQESEFSGRPVWALPQGLHWQNYVEAWTTGHMGTYFRNSVVATFPSIALIVLL